MEEMIKPRRSLYCPITVSDIVTNNAKVRQYSLREYSHAENAAYRAFCRGPGRPQTAAFGRVYFETRRNRRSLSPTKANLGDCVIASKAMVEERSDTTVKDSYRISQPMYAERRLLSRNKPARRTLHHSPEKLKEEGALKISGSEQLLDDSVSVENKEETNDFLIDLNSDFEEKRCDTESNVEMTKMTSGADSVSDRIDKQLIVYHFVDNRCSCMYYDGDPLVDCKVCSCDQQCLVSSYSVEMQGKGHQSTPGLGNCDSMENRALWDLLQKQLSLVCHSNPLPLPAVDNICSL